MNYLIAQIRALQAIQPDFESAIDQLNAIGLQRITEVLQPAFDHAQEVSDAIDAIKSMWDDDGTIDAVEAQVTENVTEEFSDYRLRYLGAKSSAPTVDDEGHPVVVGAMYFDTSKDAMQVLGGAGWKNAGSAVAGVMAQIEPQVAAAGQTEFTVPGGYDVGYLILTINGTVMPDTDYTATDGETVTFSAGLNEGDEFAGVKFGAVTLASVYNKTETDATFRKIADSYSKSQVDSQIATLTSGKANASDVYSKSQSDSRFANSDLSSITNASAARANLGVGTAGTRNDSYFAQIGAAENVFSGIINAKSPASGSTGGVRIRSGVGNRAIVQFLTPDGGTELGYISVDGAGVLRYKEFTSWHTGNMYSGTAAPSGGNDGDIYFRYS